jgi:uncharacterized lipoprotein YddW (UPF0748 family)
MRRTCLILSALALAAICLPAAETSFVPSNLVPPPPIREMRGAWVATVANIDWPSKPGLPVDQQKAELISLLDRAKQLNLNAVFFQVRPVADAFYISPLEPWSEYLTGVQGKMPQPLYDPLALAITEAHKRGLELHAWFNPFRARHPQAKSPPALNHVTQSRPEIVRHYGSQVWLDPGEPEAQARALTVVLDVLKRYDVDGIVFDDYFYPYPEKSRAGALLDFPDDTSWKKFGSAGGLSRDDWRRDNVNQFIQKISSAIKAGKPWVKFGVSPFGIWRPGVPAGISPKALDAYGKLYADARLWLVNGWVDYLVPQLYWPIDQRELSFPVLLQWWRQQNPKGRHVWAGLNDAEVGGKFSNDEIGRQIQITRKQAGNGGTIHYHLRNLTEKPALNASLRREYAQPALVPAAVWLDSAPPEKPKLTVAAAQNSASARWENGGAEPAQWWLLQVCTSNAWKTEILPAGQTNRIFENPKFDAISLRAVDRLGNLSAPTVLAPKKYSSVDDTRGATKLKK